MRAVMWEVPEEMLEERRRWGQDKRDEVWDGVLHMVPPATSRHQTLELDLAVFMHALAKRRGFVAFAEAGLYDPEHGPRNYRVPDVAVVRPEHISERGIEGRAELVVEILSPNDESREKLPLYARLGVREVWLIHPKTRVVEVFALRDGAYEPVIARDGMIVAPTLALELTTIDGPKLRVRDRDHVADV